MSPTQAPHMH